MGKLAEMSVVREEPLEDRQGLHFLCEITIEREKRREQKVVRRLAKGLQLATE